jgi:arylsulfatase A-like enzyme
MLHLLAGGLPKGPAMHRPADPAPPASAQGRPLSSSILALAVCCGIVTGFGELAQWGLDRLYSDFAFHPPDALWMIPAVDAGLFVLSGLLLLVIGRWIRVSWALAAGLFAGLGATLILLLAERLHPVAAVMVAVGVGSQTTRLAQRRMAAASLLVRRSWPLLTGLVCLMAAVTVGWRVQRERRLIRARPAAAPRSPNVLLIVLDAVRAANLSLYGYPRHTTPELERLAEGGTVFDRAFAAAPWTLPSHASIFTGRGAYELGVDWRTRLASRWPTLAEVLHARGYATAGFAANTGYASRETGLSRGFAHYEDYPLTFRTAMQATAFGSVVYSSSRPWLKSLRDRLPARWRFPVPSLERYQSADAIGASFLNWVDQGQSAPFFAFLNFMDAHEYTSPDSFRRRFHQPEVRPTSGWLWSDAPPVRVAPAELRPRQDGYDGGIAYLDWEIGHLFQELQRRRVLDHTLVIVTADHGDEFGEHGLPSHGHSLYRLSLQVPLAMWCPGPVPRSKRIGQPVSLQDLAATILDLVDSGHPAPLPGHSLARFWATEGVTGDTVIASVSPEPNVPSWYPTGRGALISIAFGGWRYIRNEGDGTEELYDFEHDLLERWNLAETSEGQRLLPRYRAAAAALGNGAVRVR